jgi:hypothetical protein
MFTPVLVSDLQIGNTFTLFCDGSARVKFTVVTIGTIPNNGNRSVSLGCKCDTGESTVLFQYPGEIVYLVGGNEMFSVYSDEMGYFVEKDGYNNGECRCVAGGFVTVVCAEDWIRSKTDKPFPHLVDGVGHNA